jgi:hypothetical protein
VLDQVSLGAVDAAPLVSVLLEVVVPADPGIHLLALADSGICLLVLAGVAGLCNMQINFFYPRYYSSPAFLVQEQLR